MAASTPLADLAPVHRVPGGAAGTSIPVMALDWANGQQVTIGSSSVASAVFASQTDTTVEMCSTTDCWYTISAVNPTTGTVTNPVAVANTAGNQFLPAGAVRYVYVPANCKLAFIQATASGNVGLLPAITKQ